MNLSARNKLTIREMALFSMFGALMYVSKLLMEFLPNIHLIGMFIVLLTVLYRKKALIPIYIFVFLTGLFNGFGVWWIPYLYVWTVLWGATMLLPKNIPDKVAMVVYPLVCAMHGILYGVIYAPAQAILFGFNFNQTLAWIAAGFYFDIIHGIGNFFAGILVLPLLKVIRKIQKQ